MRRVLILGGTGWLGRSIAQAAMQCGADVTCLARGESGAVPKSARLVRADRTQPDAYDDLAGDWDAVIEVSRDPEQVESALQSLSSRAEHWTFVSTVSVYERNDEPDADERARVIEPTDMADYAHAKVAAERASRRHRGERLLIPRPGLIVGPGDPTDRFGYWPARLHRGGRVLTPTLADRWVQAIDVDDLARWVVHAGLEGTTGTMNAVGTSVAFDEFMKLTADVAGFTEGFEQRDDEWLTDHEINYWAGPRSLPLWIPANDAGFLQRNNARYRAAGGTLRPLRDTIARTLNDELARGRDRPRTAGLNAHDEALALSSDAQR
ncbi:nucleoside-diphosphate-sugar epimerase [Salinibacterium amurskyense]|uniref:Nucleoside-diphosphate-sugar epimerase n=1 Tax=Salinibacterium amurskyense TaxID=205941 RepID=A0A2M9D2F5_9MICO|nr:NAD-dependent epimerase/dehydratase family protein [Salinibacterium amurskyense]PJJ78367.1 nucleoside-diphosphate-sugar epimerase [Salinibacterium amurskyense]RLQ80473.1 NAD-dependent epimerase/dehydratase family protein [Salinibacterium amurskyense]